MGAFNYDSFVDLSRLFDGKKGQIVPSVPKANVIIYRPGYFKKPTPSSRFIHLSLFLPTKRPFLKTYFLSSAAKTERLTIKSLFASQSKKIPRVFKEESKKARATLKLKTKVDLPPVASLSRGSTVQDLTSSFKSEMKKTSPKVKNIKLAHQFVATESRHRLSHKTWAELIAETELPMTAKRTVDLAALFKKEMEVILREQEKPLDQQKPAVRMKTAFEPKVMSPQPAATMAPHHRARRFAA